MTIQREPREAFEGLVSLLDDLVAGDDVPLCAVISAYEQFRAGDAVADIRRFLEAPHGGARS